MDKAKVDRALQTFGNQLPEAPKWIILVTRTGELVNKVGAFDNLTSPLLDDERAASLLYDHALSEIKTLDNLKHGTYQFSVSVGSEGIYFLFHLNDAYLLGISYQMTVVRSIDAIVDAVLANFFSVLEALY